jgi:GBP family porin
MKLVKILSISTLPLLIASAPASADVTIFGLVDIGPTYVSNQGGKSAVRMDAGTLQQSRLGFRGTEDLGSGYSTFFALEAGYNIDDGNMATANTLFSRDARVGLKTPFGAFSLGRQANATVDAIFPYAASMLAYGPSYYATHPGNHDRVLNMPTDNSVKYTTPSFNGLTATVLYAAGEKAGDSKQDSTRNASVSYVNGRLSLGAAYLWRSGANLSNSALLAASANPFGATGSTDELKSAAIGGSYRFDRVFVHANATQSDFKLSGARARGIEIGSKVDAAANVILGADFSYTDVADRANLRILTLSASYVLSKRTNLYVAGASESVSGTTASGAALTAQLFTLPTSSTARQRALHGGLRHTF